MQHIAHSDTIPHIPVYLPNEWKDLIKENGILYDLKGLIPRELDTLRI